MIDPTILLLTLALEIGLLAGHGLYTVNCWLHEGRCMCLSFAEAMGRGR